MEGGERHRNELIDLDTSCLDAMGTHTFISSKPLLPVPPSPFGTYDYGMNPFDQLTEITRKSDNGNNDPFEIVSKEAFGNNIFENNSELVATSNNNVSVLQLQRSLQDTELTKNPVSTGELTEFKCLGGLVISGDMTINTIDGTCHSDECIDSVTVKREEHIVKTAKLVDLPSPSTTNAAKYTMVQKNLDKTDSLDFKCNVTNSDSQSNISKTNVLIVPETEDIGEPLPLSTRKNNATHEVVKAVIAKRVDNCIQKALNDSRKLFRSKSVTDLHLSELKSENLMFVHSCSCGAKCHAANKADNVSLQKRLTEAKNNVSWLNDNCVSRNSPGLGKNCTLVRKMFSRSFDDLYADISQMKAKCTHTNSPPWKVNAIVTEMPSSKCRTLSNTQPRSIEQSNVEQLNLPAECFDTDISSISVFVEAHSLSLMLEKAVRADKCESLDNVKPPWEDKDYEGSIIEIKDKDTAPIGEKKLINANEMGKLKLNSNNSKVLSDSNMSFDTSVSMNPITHSTPVLQRDAFRVSVLSSDSKQSPFLTVDPNSYLALPQKLKPLKSVSQKQIRKGPLKAVTPVISMTTNLKRGEKLTLRAFHGAPAQHLAKLEQISTSEVPAPAVIKNKSAMRIDRPKSPPPSSIRTKRIHEENDNKLCQGGSFTKALPSTLYNNSILPLQTITGKNMVSKNAGKVFKSLNTIANKQQPKINKGYSAISKLSSKFKHSLPCDKENKLLQ